jgi:peptidoglycan/LPS O-acetylase OafA/YrhL
MYLNNPNVAPASVPGLQENAHRPEIDGLRALAVLSVIIYHFNEELLPSGYLGVDIFFVISGYVITMSLTRGAAVPISTFTVEFFSRRIKRILPALAVCVLLTSLAGAFCNPDLTTSLTTGAFALLGLSNFYLLREANDYFSQSSQLNLFTHTWSLGVEEQFYLSFPIIAWLTGFNQRNQAAWSRTILAVGLVSLASICIFVYLSAVDPKTAYYAMPSRFWELGAGVLLALAARKGYASHRFSGLNPGALLFVLIGLLFVPPGWAVSATVGVIIVSTLLIAALDRPTWTSRMLSTAPIAGIGALSYSLYLWHWSVLSLSHWTVGVSLKIVPFQLAAIFVLAALSYYIVERPLRNAQWFRAPISTVVAGGCFVMACATLLHFAGNQLSKLLITRDVAWQDKSVKWSDLDLAIRKMPCHLPKEPNPIVDCLSRKNGKPHIFVIGDSHATNLVPSLQEAGNVTGHEVVYLGDRALYIQLVGGRECGGTVCAADEVGARIDHFRGVARRGDIVMFSLSRDRVLDTKFAGKSRIAWRNTLYIGKIQAGLTRLSDAMAAIGVKMVFVDDIPKLCGDVHFRTLHAANSLEKCTTSNAISRGDRQPLTAAFSALLTNGAVLWDPHDVLCPAVHCSVFLNGKPLYADGSSHFSTYHPAPLVGFFTDQLRSLKQVP